MLFPLANRQIILADRVAYWYSEYFNFDFRITAIIVIIIIMGDHNDNSSALSIVIDLVSKRNSDLRVSFFS